MSSGPRKPVAGSLQQRADSPGASYRGSSRSSAGTSPSPGVLSRAQSSRAGKASTPVSAKAAVKRPGNGNSTMAEASDADEHERRAEYVGLLDDLKDQLRKSEASVEESRGQLECQRVRLEEALREQGNLEMQLHAQVKKIESLEAGNRELIRQQRELKETFEAERVSMLQEKEQMALQEQELRFTIQRLKENLSQKETPRSYDGAFTELSLSDDDTTSGIGQRRFAPSSTPTTGDGSDPVVLRDKTIESLRLELAEAHIKLMELENVNGGRVQSLEKMLLETRMTNAKLMEDQESFQLLLSEKTLNGDFSRANVMQVAGSDGREENSIRIASGSSLADELKSVSREGRNDRDHRLEAEVKSLQDQNKALAVYINNIIERLLQHKGYETILDKTPHMMSEAAAPASIPSGANVNKDLPPPPDAAAKEETSILKRTRSLMSGGRASGPRPRPFSQIISPVSTPSENAGQPNSSGTVQSGSLRRSDSVGSSLPRTTSPDPGQIGHMQRNAFPGPSAFGQFSARIPMSRQASIPTSTGTVSVQNKAFRLSSGSQQAAENVGSSSNSVMSDTSGDADTSSPPHSHSSPPHSHTSSGTSAPIAGNKLRPLRLVQENAEFGVGGDQASRRQSTDGAGDVDLSKKAKRSSWMGWFNKGATDEGAGSMPMGGQVVKE